MNPLEKLTTGMIAEKLVTVSPEMTVGHVVPGMPEVYGTPMMILHMEMAAGSAVQPFLPAGHVSVGMTVNIRHLAATPVGHTVRAIARVVAVEAKSVLFEVEAWEGVRKIGDGTHRRGIVNVAAFEERFGVTEPTAAMSRLAASDQPDRSPVLFDKVSATLQKTTVGRRARSFG